MDRQGIECAGSEASLSSYADETPPHTHTHTHVATNVRRHCPSSPKSVNGSRARSERTPAPSKG